MLTQELANAPVTTGFGPVFRIEVQTIGYGARGALHRVFLGDEVLVDRVREPMLEACRALQRRGHRGRVEMRTKGQGMLRMTADIDAGARLTVSEGDRQRPALGIWAPRPEVDA